MQYSWPSASNVKSFSHNRPKQFWKRNTKYFMNLPARVRWGIIASRESLAWKVEIGDSSVLFRCECSLNLHLKVNLECPKCGSTGQDSVCQEKSDDLTTFLPKYSRRTRCRWIWYIPGRNKKNKIHFKYDTNYNLDNRQRGHSATTWLCPPFVCKMSTLVHSRAVGGQKWST